MAAAAAARGTAMGLSSFASMPVEDVVAANPQTFFQIYWIGTRDQICGVVERARAAGAVGLIATLGLVLLARARLGQPHYPRDGGPAGHGCASHPRPWPTHAGCGPSPAREGGPT